MKIIIYSIKAILSLCAVFGVLYFSLSSRIESLLLFALSTWIVAINNIIDLEVHDYIFRRRQTKALNSLEDIKDYRYDEDEEW